MWGHAIFRDRRDAGRQLAQKLAGYESKDPIVLALPRGGVVVGFEIARELEAPLDVMVVRKLGAPAQPELGIGAIAPGGITLLDERTVEALELTPEEIEAVARAERAELERRLLEYRKDASPPTVGGRTVILVDDGLATGVSALAAVHATRAGNPAHVVLAIPVCARETANWIRNEVDELVCISFPERFLAVGLWYGEFEQTSDEEVVDLLRAAADAGRAPEALASRK